MVSAAGLLLLLKNTSGNLFWCCFWYGMGLFGTGASWVFISIHEHGNASVTLAATLTLLFIMAPAISFALPMSLFRWCNKHSVTAIFVFPCLWVIAEWFRSWLLSGFPWLYFGYGFIDTYLAGWAPVGGVLTISWIGIFCAAALTQATNVQRHSTALIAYSTLMAILWIAGWYFSSLPWTSALTQNVSIGIIQPSLPLSVKWDKHKLNDILNLYQRQTRQLLEQDIIVWPESAIPQLQHNVRDFLNGIDTLGQQSQTAIITGIPTQNSENGRYYNSVIALGTAKGTYHKQHLVPFGEYIPLENWLRGTIDFFDLPMSQFSSGPENQPLIKVGALNISSAICYEIVFPELVARSAANAEILLTLSNDSWFGDSLGPKQHLQMARMRALENAKPLIRATNDGLTALIDKHGKITATIPAFQRTVLTGEITPQRGQTPFNRWQSIPIILLSLATLVFATLLNRRY